MKTVTLVLILLTTTNARTTEFSFGDDSRSYMQSTSYLYDDCQQMAYSTQWCQESEDDGGN
jgi:hypothetical protein